MKRKGILRKILIITVVIVSVLFIGIIALIVWAAIDSYKNGADVTNINMSISGEIVTDDSQEVVKNEIPELTYYPTLAEAWSDTSQIEEQYAFSCWREEIQNELVRFQSDEQLVVFFAPYKSTDLSSINAICYMRFYINADGDISQPYLISRNGFSFSEYSDHYIYDLDDDVAYALISISTSDSLSDVNGGKPIYFGAGGNQREVESLTINGKKPTQIIPIEFSEEIYYFWYYDDCDWAKELQTINLDKFTTGEIIELLDIEYDKAE